MKSRLSFVLSALLLCAVMLLGGGGVAWGQYWSKVFGNSNEYLRYVDFIETGDGYVVSYVRNYDPEPARLARLDMDGNVLWVNSYGTGYITRVFKLDNGGFLAVARRTSTFLQLLFLDGDGAVLSEVSYENAGIPNDVVQTSDGGYALSGKTGNSLFILKTDSQGNVLWNKVYSSSSFTNLYDYSIHAAETNDGGFILTANDLSNIWARVIVKVDQAGNVEWHREFAVDYVASGSPVIETTNGGYVFTSNERNAGFYLVELDRNGDIRSQTLFHGDADLWAYALAPTSDGGYIIAGARMVYSHTGFLIKTDKNGSIEYEANIPAPGGWRGPMTFVRQASDGGYLAAQGVQGGNYPYYKMHLLRVSEELDIEGCYFFGRLRVDTEAAPFLQERNYVITAQDQNVITTSYAVNPLSFTLSDYTFCYESTE